MDLIRATETDLEALLALYRWVIGEFREDGQDQCLWRDYTDGEVLRKWIAEEAIYVRKEADEIVAAVAVSRKTDEKYRGVGWTWGVNPGMIHGLAVRPDRQGKGLGSMVMDDALGLLRDWGCDSVRCDTNVQNRRAIDLYERIGFRRCCGTILWEGSENCNLCFDKPLQRETPLLPIRMKPAFRGGELTPWGGEKLQTVFHKEIPEVPTGESLEVSCIPGLESTDEVGRKLPELLAEFGWKMIAKTMSQQPFPLLLKLIDAREPLSVQVHPDNDYAALKENGKLGKTEAWLILDAPEGAELVYGIVPGTKRKVLAKACREGSAVEPLLRRVPVQAGDVCYIPAGCVHAIGAGITLYEIQQSSDLTYRFYDWDRTDAQGRKRELHLKKALDVTNLKFQPAPIHPEPVMGVRRVLNEEYFTLDLIRSLREEKLPPVHGFGLLTVLEGTMELRWENGVLRLKRGDTCFLPVSAPALRLVGLGTAALSMPA